MKKIYTDEQVRKLNNIFKDEFQQPGKSKKINTEISEHMKKCRVAKKYAKENHMSIGLAFRILNL